jgi:hypothetical protein
MSNLQKVIEVSQAHAKQANAEFYDAVQTAAARSMQGTAARNAAMLGLVGLGTGAGARGLVGLLQMFNRKRRPFMRTAPAPVPVDVHVEEEEQQPKLAGVMDFLRGDQAQSVSGVPWAIPAAVGAGAAGLAGGWGTMDYLMDKRRKGDLQAELDQAKQEYEQALMAHASGKTASEHSVNSDLDELYDTLQTKSASWSDMAGRAAGTYGVGAGITGLISAMLAYNYGQKRQQRNLVDKAIKERRRRRYSQQPAPLYARPVTLPKQTPDVPSSAQTAPPDHELESLDI